MFIPNIKECKICGQLIKERYHTQKFHNPAQRPEIRDFFRKHHTGGVKTHTEEIREIIRTKNKGKKRSPETKIKLSLSKSKENNPNWGKKFTPEETEKYSKAIIQSYIDTVALLRGFQNCCVSGVSSHQTTITRLCHNIA